MDEFYTKSTDPFAESETSHPTVHIRIQNRTTKKRFTFIEGLSTQVCSELLKPLRRVLCSSVSMNEEGIIKIQGDHLEALVEFLLKGGFTTADKIHVHGK